MSLPAWMLSNAKTMQRYGLSYYIATLFFPSRQKKDILVLYKFVRIPDLIVDTNALSRKQSRIQLQELFDHRKKSYMEKNYSDPLLGEAVKLWHEHDIPFRWSEEFFDAMFQDTQVDHYASYEDLQKYMYGSAQVVGLMMCKILRIPPEAYPYACALGEAMQLTNFLRDVREDRCEYKRMYMPRDLLHYYEIDEGTIKKRSDHSSFLTSSHRENFSQHMIKKADDLYAQAEKGFQYIPSRFRKPIRYASRMYQAILRKIERKKYNVFGSNVRTDFIEKIKALMISPQKHNK